MSNLPPLRPPPRLHSPTGNRSHSSMSQASVRSGSSLSTTSNESNAAATEASVKKRSPYIRPQDPGRASVSTERAPSESTSTLHMVPRQAARGSYDGSIRNFSPNVAGQQIGHRAKQHSQGFFEPSLPNTAANNGGLSASQIAAQTAMHHVSPPPPPWGQERKRSYPFLAPINTNGGRRLPNEMPSPQISSAGGLPYSNGSVGGHRLAAATAANAAFPNGRSPLPSPGLPPPPLPSVSPLPVSLSAPPEKEPKVKGSKMKLFKPKNITLSKDKDSKAMPSVPSPGKPPGSFLRNALPNASTTSLLEPLSSASSIYSSNNASTSTLVPATSSEKDKERRPHFLSRQKNKLRDEAPQLPLSSAHSNSQATNPGKPQPLYSFMPDSPSAFSRSMSGFDIRHGGRALRERKKEEKAAAAAAKMDSSNANNNTTLEQLLGPSSLETTIGPPSGSSAMVLYPSESTLPVTAQAFSNIGAQMGLPGIGPDDAWPLLKARLLNLFSGETLRTPIEDFNALVRVHIRRCIQRHSPILLIEDVRELLHTGFSSLAQTLRGVPDDRLVTNLVEMWIGVYGAILPFLQAVFLPLELEFRGRGNLMTTREAQDFWGAIPDSLKPDDRPSSSSEAAKFPNLADELEIRRVILISFRDTVILPRHESLMNIFSRLSLENINAATNPDSDGNGREHARSDPATTTSDRPDTAGSLSPRLASFNSQGSTLLDTTSNSSGGAMGFANNRSRATSNTSAGSFGTNMPHVSSSPAVTPGAFSSVLSSLGQPHSPPVMTDPAKVTETVGRMLQCLYVLASCQTGDVAQTHVERLTGALKYNWLGRGRTGRDRRGWVGMKAGQRIGLVNA